MSGTGNGFARTPTGLLIDIRTSAGNFNPLYDAQGDIIAAVNSAGKVERNFRYGPYGENAKSEGTQTIPYPFGYKGGYRMPGGNKGASSVTNGLYHFGQRYYDPTTGRWTQQDPVDHLGSTTQTDRFSFGGGDPINESDPSGKGIIKDIFDAASAGYGCFGAATPVGVVFCVGGSYELRHEEVEEGLDLAAQGFERRLQEATNKLYKRY